MSIKKTFEELKKFNGYAQFLMQTKPEIAQTKFGYSIKRFMEKNLTKIFGDFNAEIDNIRIDNALEDEKTKAILQAPKDSARPFLYSKEGLKAVIKAENDIMAKWDKKEFEIEPFICKDKPEDLTGEQIEVFKGLIV